MDDKIEDHIDFPIEKLDLTNYVQNKELPHEAVIMGGGVPFRIGDFDSRQISVNGKVTKVPKLPKIEKGPDQILGGPVKAGGGQIPDGVGPDVDDIMPKPAHLDKPPAHANPDKNEELSDYALMVQMQEQMMQQHGQDDIMFMFQNPGLGLVDGGPKN